jgi:sulfide:quinone oxidoreductase
MKRIVIVGAGTGGTLVANLLARDLRPGEASLTVVAASRRHLYQPGWLYVPFGWQDPRSLSRPARRLLRPEVELVVDRVERLDPEGRQLRLAGGQTLDYDYLVLASGSRVVPQEVPGLAEGGQHFYTEAGALSLYSRLQDFSGGRVVVGVGGLPHKCPVAPLEFTFLLEDWLRRQGLRQRTEIVYTYPIGRVFAIESVAEAAEPLLQERGVTVETFFNLEEVEPHRRVARSLEGTELDYDLLVMVPPHRGAEFLQGLPFVDGEGWVRTHRSTLEVQGLADAWALGDATDLPISKAGSTAHFQAPVVVERLLAALRGVPPRATYDGHVMCFLETGRSQATFLDFNYDRPPRPPSPSLAVHYLKWLFNKAYFYLVPTGLL